MATFNELFRDITDCRNIISTAICQLHENIYNVVEKNGGYLDMSNQNVDNAYSIEFDSMDVSDPMITALRTNDGILEYKTETYGWANIKDANNSYVYAILSIADCISQHIEETEDNEKPWDYK